MSELDKKITIFINFVSYNKNEFSKTLLFQFVESMTFSNLHFAVRYRIIATPDDVIGGYVRISKIGWFNGLHQNSTKDSLEFLVEQFLRSYFHKRK